MGQLQAACRASGASWWRTKCASAVSLLSKKMAAFQAQLLCLPPNALHPAAGQEECESAVSLLEEDARRLRRAQGTLRLMPVPLYAGLPAAHQLEVFEPSPRGYRKVGQAASCSKGVPLTEPQEAAPGFPISAHWLSGCHLVTVCPDSH